MAKMLNGTHAQTNPTLNGTGGPHTGATSNAFDEDAGLRDCLQLYHDAAAEAETGGIFVLTTIDKYGKVRPQQFQVGDVDGMTVEARARSRIANVYFAPATLRIGLSHDTRGTANDIVAVHGLVIDDDGDTGKRAVLPPGLSPTIEVTTCTQPVVNRHLHFVFKRSLTPQEAKVLAELLHRKCGGDHGTKDIAHVWRLPQTLNHPNSTKLARGRPAEAQNVEVTGGTFEPVDPDELRRQLEAMPDAKPRVRRADGAGCPPNGEEIDSPHLPHWLQRLTEQDTGCQGDRSSHCHHVMQALMEYGLSDSAIRNVADSAPFAHKYSERGDLDAEIERARAHWQENGAMRVEAPFTEAAAPYSSTSDVKPWPILESTAAHGLVGEIAELATRNSEADPIAVMATTVAWGAAIFGRNRFMSVGDTAHHPRHFCALVGASSRARKGTSLDPVRRIFKATERSLQSQSTLVFPSGLSLKLSHGPLSSGEGLLNAIRDKRDDEDTGGVEDKRLLCIEGEFGAVLRSCQRQGNTLSTTLRVAWDGWTLEPLTKHDKVCATDPHVCVVGHITGHELNQLLTASDLWNGFANRFLWIAVRRRASIPFPKPMPDDDVERIGRELARVVKCTHNCTGERARLTLSNSAQDHWAECYGEVTAEHPGILGAVTSRAEAQALRLAMTFALFDGADRVELQHVEAALAFWRYAFDSAAYIFGGAELDPIAQKILEALATGPKAQNEIVDLFSRNLPKARINPVLSDLQDRGRITLTKEETGGRPRTVWRAA